MKTTVLYVDEPIFIKLSVIERLSEYGWDTASVIGELWVEVCSCVGEQALDDFRKENPDFTDREQSFFLTGVLDGACDIANQQINEMVRITGKQ